MNRAKCSSSCKDGSNHSCIITACKRGRNPIGNQLATDEGFVALHRARKKTTFNCSSNCFTLKKESWGSVSFLKSDLTDKMKRSFFQAGCVDTAIWMHYMDAK